ncbi:MAG: hypothetical protein IPK64_20675 [bacterium]|nr:hypothetical protein [bacterium]
MTTHAAIPHGISAGNPIRLRVRINGDTITAYVGQTDDDEVECEHTSTSLRSYSGRAGVVSAVDGAVVSYWQVGTVEDRILTLDEVGVTVIGGALYRSLREGQWELVAEDVFPRVGSVSGAALLGDMYLIGGGLAKVYDAIDNTVGNYTPTVGALPGQTAPGTTTATMVVEHLGGLVFAGMPEESLTIYGTRLNDPMDIEVPAVQLAGSPYVTGVGNNVTVGDPIRCLASGTNSSLFIGCTNSLNFMLGNPYLATDSIETIDRTVGPSGPDSALRITSPNGGQAVLMHSMHGLYYIGLAGSPVKLNENVLDEYLTYPSDAQSGRDVVLIRDPARQWLHVFIDDGSADTSVHLIYHEATGKYRRGAPGYYPITLPFRVTAAGLVRGVPIIGTHDGRLVRFSESATGDLGEPVESLITMQLIDEPSMDNDVIVSRPHVQLGANSSEATMRLYGGATAEDAFDPDVRRQLWQETVSVRQFPSSARARAPFITMALEVASAAGRLVLERVELTLGEAARSIASGWVSRPSPASICTPPASTTPPDGPSGGGTGSGGPGGGSSPPPPPPPPPPTTPTAPSGIDDGGTTLGGSAYGQWHYLNAASDFPGPFFTGYPGGSDTILSGDAMRKSNPGGIGRNRDSGGGPDTNNNPVGVTSVGDAEITVF